jgi:hypothetical protein
MVVLPTCLGPVTITTGNISLARNATCSSWRLMYTQSHPFNVKYNFILSDLLKKSSASYQKAISAPAIKKPFQWSQ